MLRITEERETASLTRLRLDGRVVGEWVGVLAQACASAREAGGRLSLDLTGVSFLDPEAVQLVRRLMRGGVEVSGSSGFVREQLAGGSHESASTG